MNISASSNTLPAPGVVVNFEAAKKQKHSTNKLKLQANDTSRKLDHSTCSVTSLHVDRFSK